MGASRCYFLIFEPRSGQRERMNLTMTLFSLRRRRRQSVLADSGEIASKIITNSCQCSILPPPSARCKMNGLDKTNTWLDLICTLYFPPNFQQHRQLQHKIAIFLLLYFVLLHQLLLYINMDTNTLTVSNFSFMYQITRTQNLFFLLFPLIKMHLALNFQQFVFDLASKPFWDHFATLEDHFSTAYDSSVSFSRYSDHEKFNTSFSKMYIL